MSEIIVKSVEEIEAYSGPHAIAGIRFRPARQALGVTAWGMNVLELDPHCEGYPEHDHETDGQEEVYLVMRGMVVLRAGDAEHELRAGTFVKVAPSVRRKLVTRDEGATLVAIGNTPGQAYEPKPGM